MPKIQFRVGNKLKQSNMKNFVYENWYKLMIGSSLLMASFGFMVHSISPAMADSGKDKLNIKSNYSLVSTNADGSINVKLSDEQMKILTPAGVQQVDIVSVGGDGSCSFAKGLLPVKAYIAQ